MNTESGDRYAHENGMLLEEYATRMHTPESAIMRDPKGDITLIVEIRVAPGAKCARCWRHLEEVGIASQRHPDLCVRCAEVIDQMIADNDPRVQHLK